jgi:mannose-1-phosphate guanylyltransferase/phosphomannomutase
VAGSVGEIPLPRFQNAFDGMFAIAKTIELTARGSLSKVLEEIPFRTYLKPRSPASEMSLVMEDGGQP